MKRLAITGGNGFVAGSIIRQAGPEWELHVLSRQNAVPAGSQTVWHTVNADNEPQLRSLLDDVRPVALVHLAAIADIDYCQAHPDEARNVNTEMTRSLAQICRDIHCRMVHVSTDTVFDGGRGMYTERDAPGPVNIYGETKAAAEMLVARTAPDWVVARLALVMGLPMLGRGNSFLARMISVLETGESLHVPIREIRTPLDVVTAGRALLELAESDFKGYLHLAGNCRLNRYEMVRRLALRFGFDQDLVMPNYPEEIPGHVPRPMDVSLDNSLARRVLKTPMLDFEQAVDLIMENK